jgi:DNA-binding transcriptional ArsR family regulator
MILLNPHGCRFLHGSREYARHARELNPLTTAARYNWAGPRASRQARPVTRLSPQYRLTPILPCINISSMPTVFDVIAEPHRRWILELLRRGGERTAGDLVARLDLAQPTVSQHLRRLREAGLVTVRVDAQRRLYRLRPEGLRALDEWLAPFRHAWADRLDDLEQHLDEMERP